MVPFHKLPPVFGLKIVDPGFIPSDNSWKVALTSCYCFMHTCQDFWHTKSTEVGTAKHLKHYHYTALQMDTVVHNSSVVINDCHISLITTVQGWPVHTSSRSAVPPVSASLIHLTHHETVFRSTVALLYSVSTHLWIKVHFSTS